EVGPPRTIPTIAVKTSPGSPPATLPAARASPRPVTASLTTIGAAPIRRIRLCEPDGLRDGLEMMLRVAEVERCGVDPFVDQVQRMLLAIAHGAEDLMAASRDGQAGFGGVSLGHLDVGGGRQPSHAARQHPPGGVPPPPPGPPPGAGPPDRPRAGRPPCAGFRACAGGGPGVGWAPPPLPAVRAGPPASSAGVSSAAPWPAG